ncbi:hypothetical protein [Burkholderia sp. Ac-20344]|uniref:hypothetical protein n=1 Tax=Burkholderia sp. Ac-20344 TaxID=2703890 RepID=UPI00197C616C|nr:hypothetical protein [Burkholderia sp. Ac-20344]MBN3834490.1 hypothetical protein [Burkholderia sp. Ac-20344]
MTILCFYEYLCEDHDAIDDGRAGERSIRGLQIAARPICNVRCRKPAICVAIASDTHAAANASRERRTSRTGNGRAASYRSMKSFDVRMTCIPACDVFTQRPLCSGRSMRYVRPHIDSAKRW